MSLLREGHDSMRVIFGLARDRVLAALTLSAALLAGAALAVRLLGY